ncbi:NAD(P)/FAD-dependent oxidoreductase [Candidatus Neoehrlichia procyonis]|uniref:Ferredoxin--NADP reductase n=1 Tax=Candidatus Neoehrlichia procyonis str. RAC413 TaxID=1359163 RepID=A0A0F3NLC5_9RICK|nr:NAD(P)/FAD-dependent oxidoreductase [Candidatus Neoehrlichia lotoris]KJV68868.1 pyridine nucleotide-disulfide oxidoreductase family protein [Candidatus Neoehrlichia lotoris str. RAC413]
MEKLKTFYSVDIAIIGAGPVGLFTVFQAGMLKMSCCVIDALKEVGGQCTALYAEKPIYDIPAYPIITAQKLIHNLVKQSNPFRPVYLLGDIAENIIENADHFLVVTHNNVEIKCKVIIIAAGAGRFGPNRPPLNNILKYENKSVFYHVDKLSDFYNKNIIIAGGGDSAADWAVELAKVAKKLYIVHRRKVFRCSPNTMSYLENLSQIKKIEIITPYQLSGIFGDQGILSHVTVKNIITNEEKIIYADVLLPFFGISANLGPVLNWGINIENFHIPVTPSTCRTNRDRIYAIGDIASYPGKLKLILTGFSESAIACHDIYRVIFNTPLNFQYSTSKGIPNNI